jgi:hypothetical protein
VVVVGTERERDDNREELSRGCAFLLILRAELAVGVVASAL